MKLIPTAVQFKCRMCNGQKLQIWIRKSFLYMMYTVSGLLCPLQLTTEYLIFTWENTVKLSLYSWYRHTQGGWRHTPCHELSGQLHVPNSFTTRQRTPPPPQYPFNRMLGGFQSQSTHFGEEKMPCTCQELGPTSSSLQYSHYRGYIILAHLCLIYKCTIWY
jgi:hypothetical protein